MIIPTRLNSFTGDLENLGVYESISSINLNNILCHFIADDDTSDLLIEFLSCNENSKTDTICKILVDIFKIKNIVYGDIYDLADLLDIYNKNEFTMYGYNFTENSPDNEFICIIEFCTTTMEFKKINIYSFIDFFTKVIDEKFETAKLIKNISKKFDKYFYQMRNIETVPETSDDSDSDYELSE